MFKHFISQLCFKVEAAVCQCPCQLQLLRVTQSNLPCLIGWSFDPELNIGLIPNGTDIPGFHLAPSLGLQLLKIHV